MEQSTTKWVKSSFCANGNCVEVADQQTHVVVRDGKNPAQAAIRVTRRDWIGFLAGVRAGDYSH